MPGTELKSDRDEAILMQRPPRSKRPKRRNIIRRRIALVLVTVMLALGLAEAAIRIFKLSPSINITYLRNYRFSDNPVITYELRPGSPDGSQVISKAGLRDREFSRNKPDNVFRIVVLGDSVTYGLFVPRDQTYAKRLESLLNRSAGDTAQRYEVLNFGVPGYNTTRVAETLRARALAYLPDLIIYGYVLNDPQSYTVEVESLRTLQDRRGIDGQELFVSKILRVLSYSKVVTLLRVAPSFLREPAFGAQWTGSGIEYLQHLHEGAPFESVRRGFVNVAESASAQSPVPVIVTIFPTSDIESTDYQLLDVHAHVAAEAKANGMYVLDLAPAFLQSRQVLEEKTFVDFLHPNSVGHKIAAESIAQWLMQSDLLPWVQPED